MKLSKKPKTHFKVWLIDPSDRTIKPRFLDVKMRDFGLAVQRMIGGGTMGHTKLGVVNHIGLHIAGDAEAPKGQPGFRIEGYDVEPTSGRGVIFGSSELQDNVRLREAPVDIVWLEQRVIWCDAAETDGATAE